MPDTPSETLIHFTTPTLLKMGETACRQSTRTNPISENPGQVTCFACRKSAPFLTRHGVEPPTPLPQRVAPVLLKDIIADSHALAALNEEARNRHPEPDFKLEASKNERGMYTVEELIHHGNYRSLRNVEVYDITVATIDGILMSSAYCYGSWQQPEHPAHVEHRRAALKQLVDDLRHGRTNRSIGWSTFRLV